MSPIGRSLRRKLYFRAQSVRLNRCFAPSGNCEQSAIRAHSVQNGTVMSLLQVNGHVKTPRYSLTRSDTFVPSWEDAGRNLATTFEGFCSRHDTEMFRPIDTRPFNPDDEEQLFLYAYRSVSRELHASMEAAARLQAGYQSRIEAGIDSGNQPEEAGMRALDQMFVSYATYEYKENLDAALLKRDFGILKHRVLVLGDQPPAIAVSTCFNLAGVTERDDWPRLSLNVFPLSSQKSVAIFSYVSQDLAPVKHQIDPIFNAGGHYQKYLISRLILGNAENFVVSPALFSTWSEEKKDKILKFFVQTLQLDSSVESEHLYLF
jgi:hypothetical protein